MAKFLGETDVSDSYLDWTPTDFALLYIRKYGQIDGEHHKLWVLDQVTRILHGTPIKVRLAKWDDGQSEPRFYLEDPPSQAYQRWVREFINDGEYSYDEGVAP